MIIYKCMKRDKVNSMNNKLEGSLTVEAALIFPIIFFTVICIIYIGIYLYDVTSLEAIVNETSGRYQLAYTKKIDFDTGKALSSESRIDEGIYWRLAYDRSLNDNAEAYIKKQIKERLIMNEEDIYTAIKLKNYVLKKYITITVEKDFNTPFVIINNLLRINDSGLNMCVNSKVLVNEPCELIRNIDMIDDMTDYVPAISNVKDKYDDKVNDIIEFFNNL
ncbi:hypothetical protein SH1V18_34200 [Vallitalea longa]|uniref:TadE-like domain-containing protein n=2 Tax=Vallitalea longa TaxID=2936439 RepID=A0A9W5YBH1_9FIRM|nr:hypothetical protein SH1V18_34200 [Vallitalea longa]